MRADFPLIPLSRYLRSQGLTVEYVRNITDIDDKIINRAKENGEVFTDLTTRFIDAMPTAIMKPFSGSGARAMMLETMDHHGVDSFAGRLALI